MKPPKFFTLLATLSLCLPGAASAQVMRERPGVRAPSAGAGAPACAADDKVEVTDFSLSPAQPDLGQDVTVRLAVKSKCPSDTRPLNIQWDVTDERDRKLAGGETQLNPGASSTFTATWKAEAGAHKLRGDVYAQEATSGQQNNWREVSVTVPRLVTQTLNHVKAKEAGASFTANAAGPTSCLLQNNGGNDWGGDWKTDAVTFRLRCITPPVGGKADYEAYAGFRLKNGWKVKSYEIGGPHRAGPGGSDWSWKSTPPSRGSDDPYVKIHLWAEAGTVINVSVKIIIEGPEGTDPYR